jgi:hypothetical protein
MIFYSQHLNDLNNAINAAEPLVLAPALHPRYIQALLAQWQAAQPRREVRLIEPWIGSMKLTPAGLAAPSGAAAPLAQWLTEHYGDLGGSFDRIWWVPDLERSLQDPQTVGVLAAICRRISASGHTLRLVTTQPVTPLPAELRPWARSLELGAPRPAEDEQDSSGFAELILAGQSGVGSALLKELRAHKVEGRGVAAHIFASMLQGLDAGAMNIVVEAICRDVKHDQPIAARWKDMERRLVEERKGQLQRASGLTVESTGDDELEGMNRFQRYLEYVDVLFRDQTYHRKEGGPRPRGVLLVGLPGCGKSLAARITARKLNVPLLRMDIGAMMGRYLGESEGNLRRALDAAEAAAPCVLWVDELEKALGGVGSGQEGGGTGSRMLAQLLTWMQSHDAQVYLFATANKVSELPPELMRRGRFDELWRVMLPREDERRQILLSKLKKVGQECAAELLDPNGADLKSLVKLTNDYTGADLESLVTEGWMRARVHEEKVTLATLKAIQKGGFMPMSAQFSDKIKQDIAQLENHGFRDVYCKGDELPPAVPDARMAHAGRLIPEIAAIWKAFVGTVLYAKGIDNFLTIWIGYPFGQEERDIKIYDTKLDKGFLLKENLPSDFYLGKLKRAGSNVFIEMLNNVSEVVFDREKGVCFSLGKEIFLIEMVDMTKMNLTVDGFCGLLKKGSRGMRFNYNGVFLCVVFERNMMNGFVYSVNGLSEHGTVPLRGSYWPGSDFSFEELGGVDDLYVERINLKYLKGRWAYSLGYSNHYSYGNVEFVGFDDL